MEVSQWLGLHWFDLLQTVGIVGSLLFTAYALKTDEKARKITNLIAMTQQRREIWSEFLWRPELSRVLKKDADVKGQRVSDAEELFVNALILQLATVYRAMKEGMFVPIEGLRKDITGFFSLPIPKAVWKKLREMQDRDFVLLVESCLRENHFKS